MHPGKTSAGWYPYHGERVVVEGGGGGAWREGSGGGGARGADALSVYRVLYNKLAQFCRHFNCVLCPLQSRSENK